MGLGTGPRVTGQPAPKNRRLLLVGRVAVALLSAILHLLEHQLYPQVVTVTDALKMPFKGLHFLQFMGVRTAAFGPQYAGTVLYRTSGRQGL